ncbi:hypothetical protein [Streptomyces sp. NPDC054865]
MTAQPVEPARRIPTKTLRGIRAALPEDQLSAFDQERDDLDLGDLTSVGAFRDKWWGRSVAAVDSTLEADFDAGMAGGLEIVAGWDLGSSR